MYLIFLVEMLPCLCKTYLSPFCQIIFVGIQAEVYLDVFYDVLIPFLCCISVSQCLANKPFQDGLASDKDPVKEIQQFFSDALRQRFDVPP